MKKLTITLFTVIAAIFAISSSVYATSFTLSHSNSSADISTGSAVGGTTMSMSSWYVEGYDILWDQTFYYRIGDGTTYNLGELKVDTEEQLTGSLSDSLGILYRADDFTIQINYSLVGGAVGSFESDIAEQIVITNLSDSEDLDIHFFQYSDFDLDGVGSTDIVVVEDSDSIHQIADSGKFLNEAVVTPDADGYTVGSPSAVLTDVLNGGSLAGITSAGPGDVAWAYQWDFLIEAEGSRSISKDKRTAPAPEPSSFALMLIGMSALSAYRKRRRS